MTTASFYNKNGKFYKFRISGHSGYAEQGYDIVCAAVSSMAFLTVNNITESFSIPAEVSVDEEGTEICCSLKIDDEHGHALIVGLYKELSVLAEDYPKFVRVVQK